MTSALGDAFASALEHLKRGNLPQAQQMFQCIVQSDPSHADSHHLLGVVAYQLGQCDRAIAAFRQAVALNPWSSSYWSNLGVAQAAVGQTSEAVASYRKAVHLKADAAEAHSNLGNVLGQMSRWDEAASHCRLAIRYRPDFAEAHNNLGNALVGQKRLDEAVAAFDHAVRLRPTYAEAHNNLGNALQLQDKLEEAATRFGQALQFKPNYADAYVNLGNVLTRQNKIEESIECLRTAVRLCPNQAQAHYNLGIALKQQGKLAEAADSYVEALRLQPNHTAAWSNLGNVRKAQYRFEDALECFENALRLEPDLAEAHHNRALLWLLLSKWPQGWPEYEWRWRTSVLAPLSFPQPRWDGSPLNGRTILLVAEQGLGDTLQFVRYVHLVRQRGGRVILQCQPTLRPILANSFGPENVVVQGEALPHFDVYAPLLSVPGILETSVASVPGEVPYLNPDGALVESWRAKLAGAPGLKVGIAWQGNPAVSFDRWRSIPLAHFAPLAKVEGVTLISLQKGPGTEQLKQAACKFPVLDFGDILDESSGAFMDTAAIMTQLDLVISSDTAVPHLAGALNVPVWVALPLVPDWRWLLQRQDSPWYPTMRLFRQSELNNWEKVFKRLAAELNELVVFQR